MLLTKELTCIGCPMGCQLQVQIQDGAIVNITGYNCQRGRQYAQKEVTAPARIVTGTAKVTGGVFPRVPVKTKTDIPKDKIFQCMEEIHHLSLKAPVEAGSVIIKNTAETGVDLIATGTVLKGDQSS